jgi:hypothetical protein
MLLKVTERERVSERETEIKLRDEYVSGLHNSCNIVIQLREWSGNFASAFK